MSLLMLWNLMRRRGAGIILDGGSLTFVGAIPAGYEIRGIASVEVVGPGLIEIADRQGQARRSYTLTMQETPEEVVERIRGAIAGARGRGEPFGI